MTERDYDEREARGRALAGKINDSGTHRAECRREKVRGRDDIQIVYVEVWAPDDHRYPSATVAIGELGYEWGHRWEHRLPPSAPPERVAAEVIATLGAGPDDQG